MADNTLTVTIDADTTNFQSGLNAVNAALGYTAIQTKSTQQPIQELYGTLQKSSDQAVASLIKGSETWRQAMFNVAQSLEIRFAQLAVNRLLNDTVAAALGIQAEQGANAAKIASNQAMNNAITTSDQAAATASGQSSGMQLIKQIQSDSAATYAGVYAYLSPALGPAAAIPAGISAGAVAAMEGLVSLDVGAWNVPQDMPAYLHAGEMVVPQNFASGMRDGSGFGGGDSYTININAIDTQTGTQFLKNNAAMIAQTLSTQARNFNRSLPVWKT